MTSNGWDRSALAWIASMGQQGDWARQHVLDAVMLGRLTHRAYRSALEVGCGEGRFCRMLKASGITAIGIDPTSVRSIGDQLKSMKSIDRARAYAKANPAKVLGGLAAVAIGLGLMRRRRA